MSTARKNLIKPGAKDVEKQEAVKPRSLAIAAKGIKTGADFAGFMSAVMADLIKGNITPVIGNAVCNAGGKLLKVVEMQYRYASQQDGGSKILQLVPPENEEEVKS